MINAHLESKSQTNHRKIVLKLLFIKLNLIYVFGLICSFSMTMHEVILHYRVCSEKGLHERSVGDETQN
jgi:hypothetical protein